MINPKIFKAYDIRGIYPTEFNEESVYTIAKAFYSFFSNRLQKKNLTVVVGGDMRVSTPSLLERVEKALVESGADVVDIGIVSTPTFYFAVRHYNYDCGIQISASHNPKEYNGLKAVLNKPEGLVKIGKNTGLDEVRQIADSGNFRIGETNGKISKKEGILEEEVKNAFEVIRPGIIKPLTIVADPANAMGATYLEALFSKLPCRLVRMNFELDGSFPAHQADPLQFDTLRDLQRRVVEEKADLGIAPDGDGDRIFFVDEKGVIVPASVTTAIIIRELLKKYPGIKVGFDTRYIWSPLKAAKEEGGIPVITKVGHALITETMHEENLFYAGESSGHNYWSFAGGAESSIAVVLTILDTISRENKKMSEIVEEVRGSYESGEVNFKLSTTDEARRKIQLLKEVFKDGKISMIDGLSVNFGDWRFNLRASNTEPLIRLNVESKTAELTEKKKNELSQMIDLSQFDKSVFDNKSFVKKVTKPWGFEIIFTSDDLPYTGKIIHINAGKRLSLQVHDKKQESWYILNGRGKVIWENGLGELIETGLASGQGYTCKIGQRHRLAGITDCDILEVSTPEIGTTYRLEDDYNRQDETEQIRKEERK